MVVLATAASFLLFSLVAYRYDNKLFYYLGLLALFGHILTAVLIIPVVPFQWDIGQFHSAAELTLAGGLDDSATVASFGTLQAVVYAVFGVDQRSISIINSLLAVLIPLPAIDIARHLYGGKLHSSDGVMATILFLPLPFLFLALPMRDALTTFLVFIILAVIVRTIVYEDLALSLVLMPLIGAMYSLRPEWALVLVLGGLAGIGTKLFQKFNLETSFSTLVALLGSIGAVGFVLFAEVMYTLDRANAELSFRAQGGAVYLEGMQYASWLDFLIAAPGRAIYFQFAPFPLHIETVFHFLAFVSTVYIVVFVITAARSLYECETNQVVLVTLLVVYLAGITGYGLINSNFGTNVRHRIPFVFLLIVFSAPVIQRWELWVREWLGVRPDEHSQKHRKKNKTHEPDRNV